MLPLVIVEDGGGYDSCATPQPYADVDKSYALVFCLCRRNIYCYMFLPSVMYMCALWVEVGTPGG